MGEKVFLANSILGYYYNPQFFFFTLVGDSYSVKTLVLFRFIITLSNQRHSSVSGHHDEKVNEKRNIEVNVLYWTIFCVGAAFSV